MTKVKTTTVRWKDEEDEKLFLTQNETGDDGLAGSEEEEEDDDDRRAHNNLMSDISLLNKKKRMGAAPRNVRVSTKEGGTTVDTEDILNRIGIAELKKNAKKLQIQTLSEPLEKVVVRRAKRAAGYEKVSMEVEKWGSLVYKRRINDQLQYPLQQPDVRIHSALKTEEIKMQTPLEQEVYSLLQGAKLIEDKKETNEMMARKRAMSLEELKERNRLAWRQKEERRRIERKAWMQNKNKSRKFHRLLRRDRLKKQKAELEALEKTDPEAALEKLEELEKARVEERMTLRHRTSKWAHLQGFRATRDKKAMSELKENRDMHQELVSKRRTEELSDEDDEHIEEKLEALRKEKQDAIEAGLFDPSNPWTANLLQQVPERSEITPKSAIDDSFVNFKKFWDEVNRRKLIDKKAREAVEEREQKEKGSDKDDAEEEMEDEDKNSLEELKDCGGDDDAEEEMEDEVKEDGEEVEKTKNVTDETEDTNHLDKCTKEDNVDRGLSNKTKSKKGKINKKKKGVNTNDQQCVVNKKKVCEDIQSKNILKENKQLIDKIVKEKAKKKKIINKEGNKEESNEIVKVKGKKKKKIISTKAKKQQSCKIGKEKGKKMKKIINKTDQQRQNESKDVEEIEMSKNNEDSETEDVSNVDKLEGTSNNNKKEKAKKKKKKKIISKEESNEIGKEKRKKKKKIISTKVKKQQNGKIGKEKGKKKKKIINKKNQQRQNESKDNVEIEKSKNNEDNKTEDVSNVDKMEGINNNNKKGKNKKKRQKKNQMDITDSKNDKKQNDENKHSEEEHKVNIDVDEKMQNSDNDNTDDLEDHLIIIDNMFNQAELGLQRKLKRKLEKLGIDTSSDRGWTKVESKKKKKNQNDDKSILPKIEEFDFTTTKSQDNIVEGMERAKTMEDMDALQNKNEAEDQLQKAVKTLKTDQNRGTSQGSNEKPPPKVLQLDPSKFLQVDTKMLQAAMPDTITRGGEGFDDDEDEEEAEDIIREAFAEDYLVDEFRSEKNAAVEKDKPKTLSLALPGWGTWTGPNITVSKRKLKRFMVRPPPGPPRKDASMGNVIYNEKADVHDNLRKAMVSELPYPFSRVQDFEASVRSSIGRMFIPEKEHQNLIAPPVVTKLGTIIEPMTEEELVKYKNLYKEKNNNSSKRKFVQSSDTKKKIRIVK